MFPLLNIPIEPVSLSKKGDKVTLFDPLRRAYVAATPEEWVRQHIIVWLRERGFPAGRMNSEQSHKRMGMIRRSDLLIFGDNGEPVMLVECKAPEVKIDNEVLRQAFQYNDILKTKCIMLSNGMMHFCFSRSTSGQWNQLDHVPEYITLI